MRGHGVLVNADKGGVMPNTFTFLVTCQHGETLLHTINLPLTAEVVRVSEIDESGEWTVWLKSGEMNRVVPVIQTTRSLLRCRFVAWALRQALQTDAGQRWAINFVKKKF
jgi:hypothetical protein